VPELSDATFALVFYACAALAVIPAVAIMLSSEIVRQAFWLLGTLVGVAGLYLLLGADFLGVTQILVYVGGIMILILFGVMLTQRSKTAFGHAPTARAIGAGLCGVILAAALGIQLAVTASDSATLLDAPVIKDAGQTREIGELLMSDYILPFEMVSMVLLAALVGAAFLARRTQDREEA
jgi:NADH-quinone oxidoreductase subunit J